MKHSLIFLLILSMSSLLISCGDDDDGDFDARKITDPTNPTTPSAIRIFNGTLANSSGSNSLCPIGGGAILNLNSSTNTASFTFPESNGALTSFNSSLSVVSSNFTSASGAFSAVYTSNDSGGVFDNGGCAANGGYSNVVDISLNGSAVASATTVLNAPYTFSLRCVDTSSVLFCEGFFSGEIVTTP